MQKFAIKVLAVLMVSSVGITHAEFPKSSHNKNITVLKYDGEHDTHLFYSDNTYCYIWAYHGFMVVGGKWQYSTPTTIDVKPNLSANDYFGYWDYINENYNQRIVISPLITLDKRKLLLGFGNEQPDTVAWYEFQKDSITQPIPKNAKYVFLGDGSKNPSGDEYQLKRFALTPTPSQAGKYFDYILAQGYPTLNEAEFKEFNPYYEIKNNRLVSYHAKSRTNLDNKQAKKIVLNATNENTKFVKDVYDYCRTGEGWANFKPKYKATHFFAPTVIYWKGTPLEDNWQKAKND